MLNFKFHFFFTGKAFAFAVLIFMLQVLFCPLHTYMSHTRQFACYFSARCSVDKIIRKEIPSQVVYEDEKVKFYLCYADKVPIFSNVINATL